MRSALRGPRLSSRQPWRLSRRAILTSAAIRCTTRREMRVYKILRAEEWAELQAQGTSAGAPVDRADGFVHFSTAAQLPQTLALHFAGEDGLVLLSRDAEGAPAMTWEASRGGALFPHLYAPLTLADLDELGRVSWDGARHVLPEGWADV